MECGVSNITQGINNGSGIHPKRDKDSEEVVEVTVFGCKRGDNESESYCNSCQNNNQQGEEQEVDIRVQRHSFEDKEEIDHDKSAELQGEAEELGYDY